MWDGASLTLELAADGLDSPARISVSTNGEFAFEPLLEAGEQFTVTVAEAPAEHTCEVGDGSGTIGDGEARVRVSCTGPTVDIALSIPAEFAFDAEQLAYDIPTSVLAQRIGLTITAPAATDIKVGAVSGWESGQPTIPLPLEIGPNELRVEIDVDDLSRVYTLNIRRGDTDVEEFLYAKASNPGPGDEVGSARIFDLTGFELPGAVAIDGDTMVVGAAFEDSDGSGPTNELAEDAGAAYVFRRAAGVWVQEAYLKPNIVDSNDLFGSAVAIDGDTIVVGAPYESSDANGINGDAADDSAPGAGAAYVFRRTVDGWVQEAYLKASNSDENDVFGTAVAISGNTIVVGAMGEQSGGSQADNTKDDAGAAYVFVRSGTVWTQQAYLKASLPKAEVHFGRAVDIDGDTIVVGAPEDNSCYTGVNNNEADTACGGSGAAYAYARVGSTWTKKSYIKAFNTGGFDKFGRAVAVHGDLLVVGAPQEDSSSAVNPNDNSAPNRGAAYVFTRSSAASSWTQVAFLKSSNVLPGLGGDIDIVGNVIVASHLLSNVVSVFHYETEWIEDGTLAASNAQSGDNFGAGVALGEDTIVVCSPLEDSLVSGINPDDDGVTTQIDAGAVYAFR